MGIVTLTGHLGSMGDVAVLVADALGYRLVGRELVAEAAQMLGWPEEHAAEFDERTGGFGRWFTELMERIGAQASGGIGVAGAYAIPYAEAVAAIGVESDRYMAALRGAMTAFAELGNVVLVGRGGQALLADRSDALHVRVFCPTDERVRRIAQRDAMDAEAALTRVEESDRQREAWHEKYLGIDYQSPYHYSLVINTGRFSDRDAADVIVTVARRQFPTAAV